MNIDELFKITTNISTPLALAGTISTIFFLVLRIIVKKNIFVKQTKESTKHLLIFIINRIFILTLCSMILGFMGFLINFIQAEKNSKLLEPINVNGTVFLNNKELDNVTVKILEVEKSVVTNYFGKFNIDFYLTDSIRELTITFSSPTTIDHKEIFTNLRNLKGIKVNLEPKAKTVAIIKDTVYLILSGRIVNSNGDPISRANISTIDGRLKTMSNEMGFFVLESPNPIHKGELQFSFSKEGYVSRDEYFYVNTKDLRMVLDEKD